MPHALRTYHNAVVVITGAASGIGAAWAKALVARGAKVILADRQAAEAAALAQRLGNGAEGVPLDVRDAVAFESLIADVFAKHGRLDYLFNNAGLSVIGECKDLTVDDWRYVVDVNLMGVVHGVQAAYPRMIRQGFGHIVNTASMAGHVPLPFSVEYTATKFAVVGLSRSLRLEARYYGVRVSAVCPGFIRTDILQGGGKFGHMKVSLSKEKEARLTERTRPMNPDVFAEKTLPSIAKNKPIIISPFSWRVVAWIDRLFPALSNWIFYRGFLAMKAELDGPATPTDSEPGEPV